MLNREGIPVLEDNRPCIYLANGPTLHQRTKHLEVRLCGNTQTPNGPYTQMGVVFLLGARYYPRGFLTAPFIRLTLMPVTHLPFG